jgi:hypothetical protein
MTPEDEKRIRELPQLIGDEKDHERVIALVAELECLLAKLRRVNEKPQSG